MKVDDDLVQRIGDALERSWKGSVTATPDEQLAQDIAWEIPSLRAMGREAYIKKEGEAIAHLRAMGGFEDYIKEEGEAWLSLALLKAAEKGLLRGIADLVDVEELAPIYPGRYRVVRAYAEVHSRKNRPPLISELLRELGIDKPRDDQERSSVNNRETVIRRILKRFGLRLSVGKRGRRW